MINKATIVGNLTGAPELKKLPNGTSVANMSVATNRSYKDKDGNKQDEAEFHRAVVFGKVADNCAEYLAKGQQVAVIGRLRTRSWDDKDGKKRYMTEIIAESVTFGRKPTGEKVAENKEEQNNEGNPF